MFNCFMTEQSKFADQINGLDWFLYDNGSRHERVNTPQFKKSFDGFLEDGDLLLCDKRLKSVFKIK